MAELYLPFSATINRVITETPDIKSFELDLSARDFSHKPGQFVELSVLGAGECPISISSHPAYLPRITLSVKKAGKVTEALHELSEGELLGLRGAFGRPFPLEIFKGKNLLIIGGGIGIAPLRPIIQEVGENPELYGKLTIIYGARTPADLVYQGDFGSWREFGELNLTVDKGAGDWSGNVGFVPAYLSQLKPGPENTIAVTCGPPVMIRYVLQSLEKLNFSPEQVYTTLEMKMQCGVGLCGRCMLKDKYICLEGPVFSLKELLEIDPDLSFLA